MTSARAAALFALVALEKGRSDRVREVLDRQRLQGRDQALAFELAHGVLRQQRLLDHVLGGLAHRGLPKDPALLCALRLGAYQLLFSGGMPAHSAVNETVSLVRSNKGFANALLRRLAERVEPCSADAPLGDGVLGLSPTRAINLPTPLPEDEIERLAVRYSLPSFLVARWLPEHGVAAVTQVGEAASAVPGVFLRVLPGADVAALRSALTAAGVQTEPVTEVIAGADASACLLRWSGGESPFGTEAFGSGQFVAQDPTAWAAADAMPCGPGDTVIDLCAAPGTKTTWLAAKVRPGGQVFAFDPDQGRRGRIAENVARLQLEEAVCLAAQPDELPVGTARAVLVDVPCSNSGVIGRRVEVRRRLTEDTFAHMAERQRTLLREALHLVAPGGHVVYSTCSIDREENVGVVASVLAAADGPAGCELVRAETTLPLAGSHDGGYFAVIRRGQG